MERGRPTSRRRATPASRVAGSRPAHTRRPTGSATCYRSAARRARSRRQSGGCQKTGVTLRTLRPVSPSTRRLTGRSSRPHSHPDDVVLPVEAQRRLRAVGRPRRWRRWRSLCAASQKAELSRSVFSSRHAALRRCGVANRGTRRAPSRASPDRPDSRSRGRPSTHIGQVRGSSYRFRGNQGFGALPNVRPTIAALEDAGLSLAALRVAVPAHQGPPSAGDGSPSQWSRRSRCRSAPSGSWPTPADAQEAPDAPSPRLSGSRSPRPRWRRSSGAGLGAPGAAAQSPSIRAPRRPAPRRPGTSPP